MEGVCLTIVMWLECHKSAKAVNVLRKRTDDDISYGSPFRTYLIPKPAESGIESVIGLRKWMAALAWQDSVWKKENDALMRYHKVQCRLWPVACP